MLTTPHRLFYVPSSLNVPHVFERLPITTGRWPASGKLDGWLTNREFAWCVPSLHKATHKQVVPKGFVA